MEHLNDAARAVAEVWSAADDAGGTDWDELGPALDRLAHEVSVLDKAEYDELTEQERADYDDAGQHGATHSEAMNAVVELRVQRAALIDNTRRGRFCRVYDEQGDDLQDLENMTNEVLDELGRFLLVESNVGGSSPPRWYTTHATPDAAAAYNVNQEYSADWEPLGLWDLDTGEAFTGSVQITWQGFQR